MKKFKFYQIIAGMACVTSSIQVHGMENGAMSRLADGAATVLSAAYIGAQRLYYGHATLLERELDDPNTAIAPWDAVSTTNKVNRALQELEHNPARATALLIRINAYNNEHPNRPYSVSDVAIQFVRSGIEQHYAGEESKALAEAKTHMSDLQAQWRVELQTLIAQSHGKERKLSDIASVLALVKGRRPDLDALHRQFTAIHTLPENLHLTLSAPEDDFEEEESDQREPSHGDQDAERSGDDDAAADDGDGNASPSSESSSAASTPPSESPIASASTTTPAPKKDDTNSKKKKKKR